MILATSEKKLTPLMTQYWEVKNQHPDKVILFRMGDFFEMFHEDACIAAPILNIALTQRNKKSADDTPMCGVPHHSVAGPIMKLLAAGKKIAICDQIEDPKQAKGLVKRAVTRCLSPGMVYDPDTLDQLAANYLCAYDSETVSFLDTTTGEAFFYRETSADEQQRLMKILCPRELVLGEGQRAEWLDGQFASSHDGSVRFNQGSNMILSGHKLNESLLSESLRESYRVLPVSALRVLSYALSMQGAELSSTLGDFVERRLEKRLVMSPTVLRHLEIFSTYKGDSKGSLFFAINRTKTSAGGRCLKSWLQFPLADEKEINQRLDRLEKWTNCLDDLQALRRTLSGMGDVERRLGKISSPSCSPRDVESLKDSLEVGLSIQSFCDQDVDPSLWQTCSQLTRKIDQILENEAPPSFKDSGIIRRGFDPQLDEWIRLSEDSQTLLAELEARERSATEISSLKVRYNGVFGFYIEITNAHKAKVPSHYLRKQTLANAERFTTDELIELEKKVLTARTKRLELEREIFAQLRQHILRTSADLLVLSKVWSELDVVSSLAWLALEYKYCRPKVLANGQLQMKSSRHPVVEQEVHRRFVPNDISLDEGQCLLLTGPNMAGKSTLMRQVAISAILAQVGSFVPAESALMPIFDRIFTRIGASDYISEGLSTFMVEMQETAEMLYDAGPRSLVILDEVGRGTSTYDGMCLAQAILEFLVERKRSLTLFATHYHELTQLESRLGRVKNGHMSIVEKSGDIQFLHTLVPGPANKSYGIQVAKLAGLPKEVTQRAQGLLKRIEIFKSATPGQLTFLDYNSPASSVSVESSGSLGALRGESEQEALF